MIHHRVAGQRTASIVRVAVCMLLALAFATGRALTCRAAELTEQAHSLKVVPADAAFYSASLRIKEQWDILLESKAFDKLLEIPVIQLIKIQIPFQWQQASLPGVAPVKEYIESPEGQEAVALVKEMFSDETFLYGGHDVASVVELLMQLNGVRRVARVEALATGRNPDELTMERIMEVVDAHAEEFKVPSVVMGWRIKDAERAERKLDEVHGIIRHFLDEHHPDVAAHLQRDEIGGHEFLTFRVDGSMIPWDQIREQAEDMDPEMLEKWQQLFSTKTLAVALGVVDEFVLLAVGDSTEHLETFGQGPSVLEQPAMARLNKHADERVVSLQFVSKAFSQNLNSPDQTIEDLVAVAEEVLHGAKVSDEQRTQIVDDIRGLGNEVKKYMPVAGDVATVTFLTQRGYEGFQYQSSPPPALDSSESLSILNHVGGSPLLVVASRSTEDPKDYDRVVEWIKRIGTHIEPILEEKMKPEDWAQYQKYRDRGIDLLRRLNDANRDHLIPALRDGQWALVMDATAKSRRWIKQMPKSPKPLPMLELAVVVSVDDEENLKQGMVELFDVARDAVALARDIHPDDVPEFELPRPEKRELDDGGTLYVYALPEEWGIDPDVAINGGITESVAAATALPATTERLLRDSPLKADTSLDLSRPAALVSYIEFAEGIDAIRPWIDYGFDVAVGKIKVEAEEEANDDDADDDTEADDEAEDVDEASEPANPEQAALAMQMGFVVPQVQQFLEVAKVLRSFSSVSYEDDGVWVTHTETHIKDLE